MEAPRFRLLWRPRRLLVALAMALVWSARAWAQDVSATAAATQRPADFDPKALTLSPRPRSAAEKTSETTGVAPVVVPAETRQPQTVAAPKPGAGPQFLVDRLVIEGDTILGQQRLRFLGVGIEGRRVTLAEIEAIGARIEAAYRRRGYFLARVAAPPQEVTGGTVRLVISPGRYGAVQIDGADVYPEAFLRRFFEPAMRGGLVREGPLMEALLQLNQLPDLSVQSVFTPGQKPGTTDVILRVHDEKPLHVAVDYNNFGSRLVGRNRVGITLDAGRAFTDGDQMVLRVVEPFPAASDPFYQASYARPIGRRYERVGLLFASGQTRVRGQGLDDLDIRGKADVAGFTYQRPVVSKLDVQTSVNASLQGKNIRNFVLNDRPTSHDKLRMITGGISTSQRRGKQRLIGSALLTQGLGTLLGGSPNDNPLANRAGTGNTFTKLGLDASLIRQLDPKRFVVIRASAQVASRALTVAEQYAIGGPDSVRGYVQSEVLGDDGFSLSSEYRTELYNKRSRTVQGVAFADFAHAGRENAAPGELEERNLLGAGVGLRAYFSSASSVRVDLGVPLSPSPNVDGDSVLLYAQASHRY